MTIDEALQLKRGDSVRCQEERESFIGIVYMDVAKDSEIHTSYYGHKYVWVVIKDDGVWPSNRLEKL